MTPRWSWLGGTKFALVAMTLLAVLLAVPALAYAVTDDQYEPDDQAGWAGVISTDGSWQRHTMSDGDSDWVKFPATRGTVYRVDVAPVEGRTPVDVWVSLQDSKHWGLLSIEAIPYGSMEYTALADEMLYLGVGGYGGSGEYQLSVTEVEPAAVIGQVAASDPHVGVPSWQTVHAYRDMGGYYEYYDSTSTDHKGRYSFRSLPDGDYKFEFASWGGQFFGEYYQDATTLDDALPVAVSYGSVAEVDFFIDGVPASIAGHLTDVRGRPVAGGLNAYQWNSEFGFYEYVGSTDCDDTGAYSLRLQDGEYALEFYDYAVGVRGWWPSAESAVDAQRIPVTLGSTFIADYQVQGEPGAIAGTVVDENSGVPIESAEVSLMRVEGEDSYWWDWAYTDAEGRYDFSNLPGGTYVVSFYHPRYFSESYNDRHQEADRIVVESGEVIADAALMPRPKFGPDQAERDNSKIQAPLVDPDGSAALHTVYPSGDVDYVKFRVQKGLQYTATVEFLEGWADYRLSALDDDGVEIGWDWASKLSFVADYDGYAYFRVSSEGEGDNPFYTLSVSEAAPASISGTVSDQASGDRLEGVEVNAYRAHEDWWGTWVEWSGSASTDASGEYRLENLIPGEDHRLEFGTWNVPAYASEWFNDKDTFESSDSIVLEPGGHEVADAQLEAAVTIKGTVTDEQSGEPVSSQEVGIWRYTGVSSYNSMSGYEHVEERYTDGLGNYSVSGLRAGSYKVLFSSGYGYREEWFDNKPSFKLADELVLSPGELRQADAQLGILPTDSAIKGVVTDRATGRPLADIRVIAYMSGYGMSDYGMSGYGLSGYAFDAYTDANGRYRIGPIDMGPYEGLDLEWRIGFVDMQSGYLDQYYNDKQSFLSADPVTLPLGQVFTANAALDEDPAMASVHGRIIDEATGEPLANAWVHTHGYLSGYGFSGYDWDRWTLADSEGYYTLRGLKPGAEYALHAGVDGDGSIASEFYRNKSRLETADRLVFSAGERREIDFELGPPAELSGVVTLDGTGLPAKGVSVDVYEVAASSGYGQSGYGQSGYSGYTWLDSAVTDRDGRYSFEWMAPGSRVAILFHDDENGRYRSEWYDDVSNLDDSPTPLTLVSGVNTADASLALHDYYGRVSGRLTDEFSGAGVFGAQVDLYTSGPSSGYTSGYVSTMSGYNTSGYMSGYYWFGRTHTGVDGTYSFAGLTPSIEGVNYRLLFSDPFGRYFSEWFDNAADAGLSTPIVLPQGGLVEASAALMDAIAPEVVSDAAESYETVASFVLSASDQGSGVEYIKYRVDDGDWITISGSTANVSLTGAGSHVVEYLAADKAGNVCDQAASFFAIERNDTTPPATSSTVTPPASENGWRKGAAQVELSAEDSSGVQVTRFRIGEGATSEYTGPFDVPTGEATVVYWSVDNAGNAEEPHSIVVKSDDDAPVTSAYLSGVAGSDGWRSGATTVTLDAVDSTSDVGQTFYRIQDGAPAIYNGPFAVPQGEQVVSFWSVDLAGNAEGPTSIEIKSDGAAPDSSAVVTSDSMVNGWRSAPATVSITATDSVSGVATTYYRIGAGSTETYAGPFALPAGEANLVFWSVDVAGNVEEPQSIVVASDGDVPDTRAVLESDSLQGGWRSVPTTVTLFATDPTSNVDTTYYRIGGGVPLVYTSAFAVPEGETQVTYWSSDAAGNVEEPSSITVRCDGTAPATSETIDPDPTAEGWRAAPATVTLSTSDALSGPGATYYRIGTGTIQVYGGPFTLPEGATSLTFWSSDVAGNVEEQSSIEVKSDGDAPVTAASASSDAAVGDWRSVPTTVTLTATDPTSGVSETYYRIGAGSAQAYTVPFAVPQGEQTVSFWSVDLAGNAENPKSIEINSDSTPPTTSMSYSKVWDKWSASPATVTLAAVDSGVGVGVTCYDLGAGEVTYTGPFSVDVPEGAADTVTVSFASIDKFGAREVTQTSEVYVDNAAPAMPGKPSWTILTTSTVSLRWPVAADEGAGVALYKVYKDGVEYGATATASGFKVAGLAPDTRYSFTIQAVDGVGNESESSQQLVVKTAAVADSGSGSIDATGSVTETVTAGDAEYVVSFADVTSPGNLTVSVTSDGPATADAGFRFLGLHLDIQFDGQYRSGSAITITLPYDPAISDGRIQSAKVKHWTGTEWETLNPVVDLEAHTVTFTVTSLSPFALAESDAADKATTMSSGFGTVGNTATRVVEYGGSSVLVCQLRGSGGEALSHKSVEAQYYDASLKTWVRLGPAVERPTSGEYSYTISSTKKKTSYRLWFAGDTFNDAPLDSPARVVLPKVKLTTPSAPASAVLNKSYRIAGTIYPAHTTGSTSTVKLRCERWERVGGTYKWVYRKGFSAKISYRSGSASYYSGSIKLGSRGRWRVVAYAPTDTDHYKTYSSPSRTFSVR